VISLDQSEIPIQPTIKILGIVFDKKLDWNVQISHSIEKAMKTKRGIGFISKYLKQHQLRMLSTSLFYSRLYYGAEVWLKEDTTKTNLDKLLRASTSMLKIISMNDGSNLTSNALHSHFNQMTPEMIRDTSTMTALYNVINYGIPESLIPRLVYNSVENRRHNGLLFTSSEETKIGRNSLANRVKETPKGIEDNWHDMPKNIFRKYIKKKLMKF
jgi:hypothetical protein